MKIDPMFTKRYWGIEKMKLTHRWTPGFIEATSEMLKETRRKHGLNEKQLGWAAFIESGFLQAFPELMPKVEEVNKEWREQAHVHQKKKRIEVK